MTVHLVSEQIFEDCIDGMNIAVIIKQNTISLGLAEKGDILNYRKRTVIILS
jgi:hypothetical protein